MRMKYVCRLSVFRRLSVFTLIALSLATASAANSRINETARISIKNFGRINENYYRGAQPQKQDYAALASLGVKTVIDLQCDGRADEQQMVEAAGMRFARFRMNTTDTPDRRIISEFLKLVNDPKNQPVYVHCKGGRHRTGVMTALYRLTHDAWTADQAFSEMKRYEFGHGFGHGALKDCVYNYFAGLSRRNNSDSIAKESIKTAAGDVKN